MVSLAPSCGTPSRTSRIRPKSRYFLTREQICYKCGSGQTDVWQYLQSYQQEDRIIGQPDIPPLVSSKYLHCRAKNSIGFNVSSVYFQVQSRVLLIFPIISGLEPGDPPRNVRIANVDARHVAVVWEPPNYPNQRIEVKSFIRK